MDETGARRTREGELEERIKQLLLVMADDAFIIENQARTIKQLSHQLSGLQQRLMKRKRV